MGYNRFMKPKIALVAPLVYPIGPPFSGGAQVVVYDLARGLTERGYDLHLFVAPGSNVPGVRLVEVEVDPFALQPATFTAQGEQQGTLAEAFYLSSDAFRRAFLEIHDSQPPFDLVHCHAFDYPAYTLASFAHSRARPIHTLHLPAVDPAINRSLASLQAATARFAPASRPALVTVSQRCAATYTAVGVAIERVIYNGVAEGIPYRAQAEDDHLLFVGRIAPEKGAATAIRVAQASGRRLLMLGAIYDQQYYRSQVAPHLGAQIEHRGAVSREQVYDEMGRAAALLFPVAWDEPFGLVAAEAMAAGTPVLAYARGALPEIVVDGESGYLLPTDDEAGLIAAVGRVGQLERAACHAAAVRRFSLSAMLDAHESLYTDLLAEAGLGDELANDRQSRVVRVGSGVVDPA